MICVEKIRFYQVEGMRRQKQFSWKYIGKNVSPDEKIGSARPVCCWGNIGELVKVNAIIDFLGSLMNLVVY